MAQSLTLVLGGDVMTGCGDLINDYEGIEPHEVLRSGVGCLYRARLAPAGALRSAEIVPMRMRHFPLERADAAVMHWVAALPDDGGRALGTRVEVAQDGVLALRWVPQAAEKSAAASRAPITPLSPTWWKSA